MSMLFTLIRREFWEHRSLVMAPAITTGILLFLFVLGLAFGVGPRIGSPVADVVNEVEQAAGGAISVGSGRVSAVSESLFAMTGFPLMLLMVLAVMFFVVFNYAASCVFDERKDRSVLFWRSLPVSDALTLGSKWLTAMIAVPMLAGIVVCLGYVVLLALAWLAALLSPESGQNLSDAFLFDLKSTLGAAGLAFYTLFTATIWLAPLVGWCMLVASWAKRSPLLSAAIPVILIALGSLFVMPGHGVIGWIWDNLFLLKGYMTTAFDTSGIDIEGSLGDVISGTRARSASFDFYGSIADPLTFFSSLRVWIGLMVSLGLLGVAIYIRRFRDEAI